MQQTKHPYQKHLFVCTNLRDGEEACCARGGGEEIREMLKRFVKEHGLRDLVRVSRSGCQGLCEQGPNVMVFPDGTWYHHVQLEDLEVIIQTHLAPLIPTAVTHRSSAPVRVILFDLGNVLLPFDHMRAARALAPHVCMAPERLYQSFFESPLQALHDEGRITGHEFYARIRQEYGLAMNEERFFQIWNDIFWEDPMMTTLVAELARTHRLIGISNTNQAHFEFVRQRYAIVGAASRWIVSHEVGARKPDPKIYREALAAAGVPPDEIVYVDDRLDLVEAGAALGLRTHAFISAPRLRTHLRGLGVLPR